MSAIVVGERRVISLQIVIDNELVIKYYICGPNHWWTDENDKKVDLSADHFTQMKDAVRAYMKARRKVF